MRLALRDLEIRGAGNILGPEQHGFISEVGYDLYSRILTDEMDRMAGKVVSPELNPVLDIPLVAYLPEDYIPTAEMRIMFYKRILAAQNNPAVDKLREELVDRFGPIPAPVEGLLELARLRILAQRAHIRQIRCRRGAVEITFLATTPVNPAKILQLAEDKKNRLKFRDENGATGVSIVYGEDEFIPFLKNLLFSLL